MGCVGIGRVGQVHHAKLKGSSLAVELALTFHIPQRFGCGGRRLPVPGGIYIDVLPEVKAIFTELVGIGSAAKKGVPIVTGQGQVLYLRVQAGVGLGGSNSLNPILQRNPGPRELCIGIGGRIPGQQILRPVSMRCWLILPLGALPLIGQRRTGEGNGWAQR